MELLVTAAGKTPSGKTRTLRIIKDALLAAGGPVEEINVMFYEVQNLGPKGPKDRVDQFTVEANPSDLGSMDTHRETWSIIPDATGRSSQVMRASEWQATFKYQAAARTFIQWMTATKAQRHAIGAILADPNYGDGIPPAPNPSKNCQGGGGDFARGAGVISEEASSNFPSHFPTSCLGAEMAPAIHGGISKYLEDEAWRHGALGRMIDRWEGQRKTINSLHDLLGTAADVFDRYAEDHTHKASNLLDDNLAAIAWDKAERNRRMARMCRAVIPTISELPPSDVVEFTNEPFA